MPSNTSDAHLFCPDVMEGFDMSMQMEGCDTSMQLNATTPTLSIIHEEPNDFQDSFFDCTIVPETPPFMKPSRHRQLLLPAGQSPNTVIRRQSFGSKTLSLLVPITEETTEKPVKENVCESSSHGTVPVISTEGLWTGPAIRPPALYEEPRQYYLDALRSTRTSSTGAPRTEAPSAGTPRIEAPSAGTPSTGMVLTGGESTGAMRAPNQQLSNIPPAHFQQTNRLPKEDVQNSNIGFRFDNNKPIPQFCSLFSDADMSHLNPGGPMLPVLSVSSHNSYDQEIMRTMDGNRMWRRAHKDIHRMVELNMPEFIEKEEYCFKQFFCLSGHLRCSMLKYMPEHVQCVIRFWRGKSTVDLSMFYESTKNFLISRICHYGSVGHLELFQFYKLISAFCNEEYYLRIFTFNVRFLQSISTRRDLRFHEVLMYRTVALSGIEAFPWISLRVVPNLPLAQLYKKEAIAVRRYFLDQMTLRTNRRISMTSSQSFMREILYKLKSYKDWTPIHTRKYCQWKEEVHMKSRNPHNARAAALWKVLVENPSTILDEDMFALSQWLPERMTLGEESYLRFVFGSAY